MRRSRISRKPLAALRPLRQPCEIHSVKFDFCLNCVLEINNIDDQLDATITVY